MTTRRRVLRDLASGLAGLTMWPKGIRAQDAVSGQPADSVKAGSVDSTQTPHEVLIPLANAKDLAKVGGAAVVTVEGRTLLLVRNSETAVLAFESRCTHKQVTLKYDHKHGRLNCPAHGSRFDLSGKVLRGPAKDHISTYHATLKGDAVLVALPQETEKP